MHAFFHLLRRSTVGLTAPARRQLTVAAVKHGEAARATNWRSLLAIGFGLLGHAALAADNARVSTALAPDSGHLVIEARGVPPPAPVFFSAMVDQRVTLTPAEISSALNVKLHLVQGRPEVVSLGLSGDGEVIDVAGAGLRDWSVRQGVGAESGKRFLDLRPMLPMVAIDPKPAALAPLPDLDLVVKTRLRKPPLPGTTTVLIATAGEAVGFSAKVMLIPDAKLDVRIVAASGMTPVSDTALPPEWKQFVTAGDGRIEVRLAAFGATTADAELIDAQVAGKADEATGSVAFRLRGQLRAQQAGARLRLLAGRAALSEKTAGDGWHVELVTDEAGGFFYALVADRAGTLPVEIAFAAPIREDGDWRQLDFAVPGGAVVPLRLEGLGDNVSFKPDLPFVPVATPQGWTGFLSADGSATLAWKHAAKASDGALFFSSTELAEVRIGAGLLRQGSRLSFRVLQGKLAALRVRIDGPGEIVGVEGTNVVGWKVVTEGAARFLDVRLSRPMETEGSLAIQAQAELGNWPVRAEPMRFTPEGGVRHSGFVRLANSGAVRLEVADANGMMQLAPTQFPAAIEAGARQVFVYRFPSANYGYRVIASQIQPEVSLSEIAIYELTDTARVLNASLELDVREAPLRDWTLRIPEDYTVVAVSGKDVADYVAESDAANGTRALRILFARAIEGRQLLQLRLEKNQSAAAGDWTLPALQFPGAKSVRGHIGAVATPGFRLAPARIDRLVEVPLSFFPKQTAGLQQAWRLREPDWAADVRIEALGQTVQADVFHLYAVKEGVVKSSVLINYFVVGAPASEWRLEVPAAVGNIDVTGQNVRRDWRREGEQIVVSLHQPVLGAATLLLTFEQPMSTRGGVIQLGQIRPLGVQAERGYVQVVSPLQVKHEVRRAEGLLKLEPTELPAEFRLLASAPSLAVYQYTGRPFALEMNVEWYAPGETVDQVVDFAKLSSQVSRDGQAVTEARLFVKTRGRKALRLMLPAGVKLWEARVDNELVNARVDGDQTLVPLPARTNPNEPVTVALRVGQPAGGSATAVTLVAPRAAAAPTVISEWVVRSDAGRLLVPRGGSAELTRPTLTETGFEWITRRSLVGTFALLGLVALAAWLLRGTTGLRPLAGVLIAVLAVVTAFLLANDVLLHRRVNLREATYASTVVSAGDAVSIQVANVSDWRAMLVSWGAAAIVVGGGLILVRRLRLVGLLLVATGILAQHGGAIAFFLGAGVVVITWLIVPAFLRWRSEREPGRTEPGAGTATVVSMLAVMLAVAFGGGDLRAAQPKAASLAVAVMSETPALPDGTRPLQSIVQTWSIRGERLFAEMEIAVRGTPGDSFLLLKAPAVLTEFKGDGLRVNKADHEGEAAYYVAPEREGLLTARVKFELAVPDRTKPIVLPTGPAAAHRLTLELDQGGWEFTSPLAVQNTPTPGLGENRSGATLVLAPHSAPTITLQPKRRDLAAETTVFFVETANLYVPGPGVVNGLARVVVRPVQGRVSAVEFEVPKGFTVGDVARGPVGAWRFDPERRRLRVAIEPAQSGAFRFDIETQLGTGELPFALALEPLRAVGAAGDVGAIALAFGGDAQPEGVRAADLSAVNVQDFDATLLPRNAQGQPLATVQQVWRYGPTGGRVELKIAPVAPEVRVSTRQLLTLDDDRMVMSADLHVAITRVGLFKLSFVLPEGLEIEALSGPALSHWTEATENNQRIVTLHLNGRTLGEQTFSLSLAGAAPGAQASWATPRILLREATRQTGEAVVVPGRGLRVRAVDREKVTQLDPRAVGALQPGSLAFRLLQEDWVLRLGIELLDPWVTVQALQEVTVREGQTLTRLALRYRVENAAVKHVQVKLAGLGEERARTVRASGPAVSDIVKLPEAADTWEIRFQRGVVGETEVQIEYQGTPARSAAQPNGQESVVVPEFPGAKQATQFVALRSAGRLELDAPNLPRGWTRVDWGVVPAVLQNRADRSVPALCFRVAEPEGGLAVTVRRHEVAEALKLRVTQADLTTLFSPSGAFLTAVDLKVEVLEKSTLRVRLPEGARLFNTFVNGESVSVVREGDAWLFHVTPNTSDERNAAVKLVYSVPGATRSRVALTAPSLSVPLEHVAWRVVLPSGYELDDYRGTLRLREESGYGSASFSVSDYQSLVVSKRAADVQQAQSFLQQASVLLQKGEQDKAAEALSRVSQISSLDAASNEDARVQLQNLKTQQAVLGLNTRRQKLYLENRADAARNEQLEQAANLNPFMQGKLNFDPRQVDQLLMGNTAEENTALKGIAARIVEQQLGAEPAPGAIDVTLPERGRVFTFTRSLQVDGSAPLELSLDVRRAAGARWGLGLALLAALAACGWLVTRRPAAEPV